MKNKLLVIIDDEEDLLDLLEYNFTREGYEVEVFTQASQALAFMIARQPDMILCDWMMPGMDGIELCKQIKTNRLLADIPVVMVTCRTEKDARVQAIEAGVAEFISKPVRIPDLLGRVQGLLRKNVA
ncbi:MAG: response regulator [Bacteroidia bacterium]|jgi:DNA-binding response OmpR family regulator|nr:response regulator [Bacteroidia bacterium]